MRILEILERQSARVTFFSLGWVAERQPRLIRAISATIWGARQDRKFKRFCCCHGGIVASTHPQFERRDFQTRCDG
jgi:peptidoglycan/xylan/chitin deacetylase (PgdA/CDA1 family)